MPCALLGIKCRNMSDTEGTTDPRSQRWHRACPCHLLSEALGRAIRLTFKTRDSGPWSEGGPLCKQRKESQSMPKVKLRVSRGNPPPSGPRGPLSAPLLLASLGHLGIVDIMQYTYFYGVTRESGTWSKVSTRKISKLSKGQGECPED